MKAVIGAILLIVGLALLGHGSYMQGKAWLAQYLIEQAWQQALTTPRSASKAMVLCRQSCNGTTDKSPSQSKH